MKNRIVNLIFPLILFILLCVAVIAVATAPRMTESGEAGEAERQTVTGQTVTGQTVTDPSSDPSSDLPSGPPSGPPEVPSELSETTRPETEPPETDPPVPDPVPETEPSPETDATEAVSPETDADTPDAGDSGETAADDAGTDLPGTAEEQAGTETPGETPPPFDVHPFYGADEETEADPPAETDPAEETDPSAETEPGAEGDPAEAVSDPAPEPAPASGEISASLSAFSPQVQAQIASMSTRELLTQMFIATYDGSWATAGYAADYNFGGYITFAEDYVDDTPESFREGIDRVTASSKIPPLYAVDEEGGTVTRASKYSLYRRFPFLSPREVYESGGLELIRADAAEKAELLKKLGINYNLAPVADISVNTWDYMYNRSPGQDAETTASIVTAIVEVFNGRGVASTVKHFPGYGAVSDTHTAMAWDGRTVEELESFDLIPFRRAMEAGVPSVMVSHIITALDPERPASVSAKVVDYIRTNMGYDGVLITDDMRMNGILDFCPSGSGSLEAILAGYDLICCTNWPEQFPVVWAAVENGSLTRERLELSAARVLRMKQDLGIWNP